MAAFLADCRTTYHTTFSLMPEPQIVPLWVTQRKMCPSAIRATVSHSSTASFTQSGTGTVRTWPPLPKRSMMAQ
jgi:hypothetical protein